MVEMVSYWRQRFSLHGALGCNYNFGVASLAYNPMLMSYAHFILCTIHCTLCLPSTVFYVSTISFILYNFFWTVRLSIDTHIYVFDFNLKLKSWRV